uniref:U1-poneritoxin-Ni1b n=1 Tax=Neoponera inversa TaxID=264722 RepID=WTX1B_NEOIV|nr:RecName: Full=U1-poneritoxin-Ni1b; Short=U1-PONTX-Ni1b; AltName: Full=Poneratoxin; AltName: Full=Ponericin Pi II2 [Neoponera inversa]
FLWGALIKGAGKLISRVVGSLKKKKQ